MPSLTSTEKENNNSLLRVENGAVWADKASAIIGTHNQIKEENYSPKHGSTICAARKGGYLAVQMTYTVTA